MEMDLAVDGQPVNVTGLVGGGVLMGILLAIPTLTIVVGTIAGNLLVCVAIAHNRQLRRNITNSFCASLAAR